LWEKHTLAFFLANSKMSDEQTYFTEYAANIKTPTTKNPYRSVQLFNIYGR
jgi:hypothetical protein